MTSKINSSSPSSDGGNLSPLSQLSQFISAKKAQETQGASAPAQRTTPGRRALPPIPNTTNKTAGAATSTNLLPPNTPPSKIIHQVNKSSIPPNTSNNKDTDPKGNPLTEVDVVKSLSKPSRNIIIGQRVRGNTQPSSPAQNSEQTVPTTSPRIPPKPKGPPPPPPHNLPPPPIPSTAQLTKLSQLKLQPPPSGSTPISIPRTVGDNKQTNTQTSSSAPTAIPSRSASKSVGEVTLPHGPSSLPDKLATGLSRIIDLTSLASFARSVRKNTSDQSQQSQKTEKVRQKYREMVFSEFLKDPDFRKNFMDKEEDFSKLYVGKGRAFESMEEFSKLLKEFVNVTGQTQNGSLNEFDDWLKERG